MLDHQLIDRLGELCGMPCSYLDWAGEPVTIETEFKVPLLSAMGFDMSSDLTVAAAIKAAHALKWQTLLKPVTVVHQQKTLALELRFESAKRPDALELTITLENGDIVTHQADLTLAAVKDTGTVEGHEYILVEVCVPEYLPLGYHALTVSGKGISAESTLIVAPEVCFEPESMRQGKKIWGSGVQLYSVRSERNWGMGDMTDLGTLAQGLGSQGADFVGLNPIHALYPSNPLHCSPYSPSSRLFDNITYLDPEQVAEFAESAEAKAILAKPENQQLLAELRATEFVEYDRVVPLKMQVLEALYATFSGLHLGKGTARETSYKTFCAERGTKLDQFALFEALFEHFRKNDINSWGWRCWPEEYHSPDSKAVQSFAKKHQKRLGFFKYLQWLMDLQMRVAQQQAKEAGMLVGVYRDLAVGVDSNGADVWADPDLYVLDASTGAPPDGLGPLGQDWGLPPFNPVTLQEKRYQPFIEMIRSNMRNCGALRIDHAMGLFRLWWCPNGDVENKGAKYGCYVHYPLQDLIGIIKLESQRQQCLVFGEDLGTVPQEITDSLPPARFYSSVMAVFEQEDDLYVMPEEFKEKALAVIVCHDTPTLRGWWEEKDIDYAFSLGFFSEERTAVERDKREISRKAVINTLAKMGELPHGIDPHAEHSPAYSRELMERFSYYLVLSRSQIAALQLEDCMMIDTPVNIPGTSSEYPNWKRRLTVSLEQFFEIEENLRFFQNLNGCRKA
ncbi:4-alpha-glucanotransferase [Parendozoicomonas haliclonae]|uniref:4-alpha-glucanotransferase n=1 Tax=Parendozoicomonas haliclonae TaxID=1960125 RepID=A0A1X7AIL6_9GAMM|nr:4-alpha-glucanotransferase [Parendozoicomonas haliclonae]SMA43991.1 4-alpha-glucanotransferase [Parendozoicomonas haliclonae]